MASEFEHYFDLDGGYKVLRSSSGNYFVDTPDGKRISLDKNPNRWASMIEHIKQGDSFIAGTTDQAKQHLLNRLKRAGYIKPTPNTSSVDDVIKDSSKTGNASANESVPRSRAVTPGFSTPEAQANPYTTVGEPYEPNYMRRYKGSTNLPVQSNTNVSSPSATTANPVEGELVQNVGYPRQTGLSTDVKYPTFDGEFSERFPVTNYRGTSIVPANSTAPSPSPSPSGSTNLPVEYNAPYGLDATTNGPNLRTAPEPSLLSRAGNFLGNVAKTGLRALPLIGAGYELFENKNPVNAAAVAGSALSPLSLLFYSTDLADGTLTPEQLEEGRKYAEKVEQTKKEIAPFIGNLGHQLVGGESIIRDLPVDPLAGIDRENKWTPNLTSGETKKVAAPRRKQVQSAPATTSVDSVISAPSDREQVMARRAAALQKARNDSATAAAQQPNFDWHYYNYVKNNLGYRSDASALQEMGYNRSQLNQFLDSNGHLRTSYIPEGFMVGR